MTANLRPSEFRVSLSEKADATIPGPAAAVAALKDVAFRHSELYPDDHSADFYRQQLRGEKPMRLSFFDHVLERLAARGARETVRRVFDQWLAKYGMCAVDVAPKPAVKKPADEILESSIAMARLISDVDTFAASGFDEAERREILKRADKVISEVRELAEACR